MANAGEIIKKFYAAFAKKDVSAALTKLLQIVVRLNVKKFIAEGDDVAVFFELETKDPAAATTLVAEWHQVKNGKISHVQSAFDGRPFAAMFAYGKRT